MNITVPSVQLIRRLARLALRCALLAVLPLRAAAPADVTQLQCGNLIYAGNKSSVCFADKFLVDVGRDTKLNVGKNFVPVRLDSDKLFDFPFCVVSGEGAFTLTDRERANLRRYLQQGGFLLASPSCSDAKWDAAFRKELKLCFPELELQKLAMTHPVFSVVNAIPRLTCKNGNTALLDSLEVGGRLALIHSSEGLNDVSNAKGCCCCGGNQINDSARVNVNIFTYSLLY